MIILTFYLSTTFCCFPILTDVHSSDSTERRILNQGSVTNYLSDLDGLKHSSVTDNFWTLAANQWEGSIADIRKYILKSPKQTSRLKGKTQGMLVTYQKALSPSFPEDSRTQEDLERGSKMMEERDRY